MNTIICFIRHGSTDWNVEKRFQGWEDIPLNEVGRIETKEIANALKDQNWEAVVCSELKRGKGTADIIGSELKLPVLIFPELIERKLGPLEGVKFKVIDDKYPGWQMQGDIPIKGVETEKELSQRVRETMETLGDLFLGHKIIVIAHGGFLRSFFKECFGIKQRMIHNGEKVTVVWEKNSVWQELN